MIFDPKTSCKIVGQYLAGKLASLAAPLEININLVDVLMYKPISYSREGQRYKISIEE